MIRLLILTSALALAACAEVESAVDRTGRQAATSAVTETIAINFPQVPKPLIEAFTGCVIDNAQAVEVRQLALDSATGVDQQTVEVVRSILARPGTQNCVRSRAASVL
tara:strand:- start:56509 stop:56832 length:324 start_codon:yes stop_codon:yes gene_type:complete